MIYNLLVVNDFNEQKTMTLSASNDRELFTRMTKQYGVSKDKVEILEKYEYIDSKLKLIKSFINKKDMGTTNLDLIKKAKELYYKRTRKSDPSIKLSLDKGFKFVQIKDDKDVVPLLSKYKNVRVYWNTTENRGEHIYFALVK